MLPFPFLLCITHITPSLSSSPPPVSCILYPLLGDGNGPNRIVVSPNKGREVWFGRVALEEGIVGVAPETANFFRDGDAD